MELWLVDKNPLLADAWEKRFNKFSDGVVRCDDILRIAENTIVSPANGYGLMDGGIDLAYTEFFGLRPMEEVQKKISLKSKTLSNPFATPEPYQLYWAVMIPFRSPYFRPLRIRTGSPSCRSMPISTGDTKDTA